MIFDLMYLLFAVAVVCLLLTAADAALICFLYLRDRRRYRRLLCSCGRWPFEDSDPVLEGGWLHESRRCYPAMEQTS